MGKEFELKYAAPSLQVLDAIEAALPGQGMVIQMSAVYFDTPAADLSCRKWTLRLRKENGRGVVTCKTAGDGKTRGEWEYAADDLTDAARRLVALGAPGELEGLLKDGVVPVCGAEFTRRAVTLERGGAVLEVALDVGRLFRGEKESPLCELEVELKSGDPASAEALGAELAARYGLREEPRSKFVRAVTL